MNKKEIFNKHIEKYTLMQSSITECMLLAMQEYADQQTEQLKKEVSKLKTSLSCSERFRMEDAASSIDEQNMLRDKIKQLQSQLTEKDKEHKEHVEKLCRNIRILEERVKDGDKELSEQIEATNRNAEKGLLAVMELSELKAKHKECLDAVIKLNDYFFCENPIDEGEYTDLIKLTEKVINNGQ